MGTVIRGEVSKNNKYWISRYRYYELKYFCLQYPEWEKILKRPVLGMHSIEINDKIQVSDISDPTADEAIRRAQLSQFMKMVEECAKETDKEIGDWIFIGVTRKVSFKDLKLAYGIPCEKEMYYNRYRKFFWILDKRRL